MKRNRLEEEEEEDTGRQINVKVVEYLVPLMSKDLLCKFPDNSALDFDYSQSSIWSPLIPRAYAPIDLGSITPRKLSNDFGFGLLELESKGIKSSAKKLKKQDITSPAFKISICNLLNKKKKMKKKIKASEFSPTPVKSSCLPITTKGWAKVLKAASKHFKRKKKDGAMHVKFCKLFERSK